MEPFAPAAAKPTVDLGDHRRVILAGMKTERAEPREIVGHSCRMARAG